MNSFLGEHPIVIDGSGRFNVPAKFKAIFDEKYGSNIVVCSRENYLMIYPQKEWAETEKEVQANKDSQNEEERRKMRQVFRNATEGEIKSGKISLPANQREKVGILLKEEAVLIGMANSFEIWSKGRLAKESG
ncbi:MAG: hypothetical protein NPINA01_04700 [Nitrospinaceae bacterium]|nr:MAG: hypothetical protein NPINA01_04700 [Nitrospinaceae bacterium]